MKILVPTKRVPDPDQRIRVREDGMRIDDDHLQYIVNPFDAIALEEAVRIQEESAGEVEVIAVGIGSDEYEPQLRTALAMGANRAILVQCDTAIDSWNVSRVLEQIVAREQPDLVLMGKQAVDDDANQTGQFLAATLDWPQATFASDIEFVDDRVRIARETDRGIEVVSLSLPAVITVDLRLNEPRYASLPSILKAKKKSIDRLSVSELGVTIEPRIQTLRLEATSSGRNCVKVENVNELIDRLRDEAKVL